ncbi:DUF4224 domain-containing protein [Paraburkholderia xenovorans]
MLSTFLSNEELSVLTGRKVKSKQIESLRRMGIAFFVNAAGRPVVTRSAIDGRVDTAARQAWQPKALMR